MTRDGYVTMAELCGVLSGCGIAYALAAGAGMADQLLREWPLHLERLAAMVDDPAIAEGLECLAANVRETAPVAAINKKRRPSAGH
jgi:hypothetical protein